MASNIVSFGHRYGVPRDDHGMVIDVRKHFSVNPWSEWSLRTLTGLDPHVGAYLVQHTPQFSEKYQILKDQVRQFPGPCYLGCTGGQHRSVYLAQRLSDELQIPVTHRDL